MGLIPDHASTVPLVLNLDTSAITPQLHVSLMIETEKYP